MQERQVFTLPGVPMVLALLGGLGVMAWWMVVTIDAGGVPVVQMVLGGLLLFCGVGFFIVQPNHSAVLQFFGKFVGTERHNGLRSRS